MSEKLDEIREVVNKQSKVIKHLLGEINMMKIVLGYESEKVKFETFFKTLESQGVSIEDAMKKPDILDMAMRTLRKM